MSKCIKCGRELNTGETLEIYSGMCGKCYEEQYDKFVKKIDGKYLFGVIEKPLRQQIDQLKQQLDEKQNEIDEINKEFVQAVHDWKTLCAEKDKEIEDCKRNELYEENMKILAVKNQTQLAIQELEKFRAKLVNRFSPVELSYTEYAQKLFEELNQQINDLRGEKDAED